MLFDLAKGPAREGKKSGTTMFEMVPGVIGQAEVLAFGGKPRVERGLVEREDVIIGGVGD